MLHTESLLTCRSVYLDPHGTRAPEEQRRQRRSLCRMADTRLLQPQQSRGTAELKHKPRDVR